MREYLMSEPLKIDYYSDVLCVWAWISQRRVKELSDEWLDKVDISFHYLNIFGDVDRRINEKWSEKGGYEGFGQHVLDAAKPYDNAPVDSEIWCRMRPKTSSNAHLILKAVHLVYSKQEVANLAFSIQSSFFQDGKDIGEMNVLYQLVSEQSLSLDKVKEKIEDGSAMASLMHDYQLAKELNIKGSPTWIMNNGRQELFGNVGYRILNANIKEILDKPQQQASWC